MYSSDDRMRYSLQLYQKKRKISCIAIGPIVVTQDRKGPVLDVYAIYQNLAGGRVDKTAQQVHDGGFAGTGGTENADCLSFFHRKLISFTISSSSAV